jgi:secondary thiamine-phosphate synthase enzyme
MQSWNVCWKANKPQRPPVDARAMLRQTFETLSVATRGRGFYECTDEVSHFVRQSGIKTGLATLHLQHTSASLLIQENADPEVRRDLERFFARLVPDGDALFRHTAEGDDDMPAHVRTALTAVNLGIPVASGELTLGTWQGIYLWEHRTHPHTRRIALHLIGE